MAKFDCINKVRNFRNGALRSDIDEVRSIVFMVGTTLVDKIKEIENQFEGVGSVEKLTNKSDFGASNKMLTAYGKKIRDYFLKIEELITFKLRASI